MFGNIQKAKEAGRDAATDGLCRANEQELKTMTSSADEAAAYLAGWDERTKEIEAWNALPPQEREALSLKHSEEFAADCVKKRLTEYAESVRKMPVICFGTPSTDAQASDNLRLAYQRGIERGIKQWAEEQLKLQPMESGR
jgi:hypothetical protein